MAKNDLTKEQWQEVSRKLDHGIYGIVTLIVDGRKITFSRVPMKTRIAIAMSIDGKLETEWFSLNDQFPEQKYLRVVTQYAHTQKQRGSLKKLSKRTLKEMGDFWNPERKISYFNFLWTNSTQIRRHYQKTFESIELVENS